MTENVKVLRISQEKKALRKVNQKKVIDVFSVNHLVIPPLFLNFTVLFEFEYANHPQISLKVSLLK